MFGADHDRLVTLAAAIEMLHTATLVHDDLIDKAALRRGIPTLNSQWTPGATVLTGDYIFARAAHLAAQTGSLAIMERFAETLMTIVNGEITQLFGAQSTGSRQDYFDRIYAKTASLFELASEGAALLGQAGPDRIEEARQFGYSIGVAFQIVDDVLDFIGDPAMVGKPVANDLRQGLLTLPSLFFLEEHPEDERLDLPNGNYGANGSSTDQLIEDIRHSGAIEQAMKEAESFASRAEELLAGLPASPTRYGLAELSRYVVQRSA